MISCSKMNAHRSMWLAMCVSVYWVHSKCISSKFNWSASNELWESMAQRTIVRLSRCLCTNATNMSSKICVAFAMVHCIAMWMSVAVVAVAAAAVVVVVVVGVDVSDDVYSTSMSMCTCTLNNIYGTSTQYTVSMKVAFSYLFCIPPSLHTKKNKLVLASFFFFINLDYFSCGIYYWWAKCSFVNFFAYESTISYGCSTFFVSTDIKSIFYSILKLVVVRIRTHTHARTHMYTLRHVARTKRNQFWTSINHFFLSAYIGLCCPFPCF